MKVYFLSIFLILFNYISNDDDDDAYFAGIESELCAKTDSTSCRNTKLTGNRLCCEIYEKNGDNLQETCEMKTTLDDQMLIVGSSKTINKELGGLAIYNEKYGGTVGENDEERRFETERTIRITCETWSFSVNIIDGEYTQEEINILKSDNHCLSYFNPYLLHTGSNRRKVTRDTCYKAQLLPSTKQEGISCGYMEITINEPNAVEKRTTCFLYDPKVVQGKNLDEATRLNLNAMSKKNENDDINYDFTIYSYNGTGYKYSSKTRAVSETEDDPSNYDYSQASNYDNSKTSNHDDSKSSNHDYSKTSNHDDSKASNSKYIIINIQLILIIILFLS